MREPWLVRQANGFVHAFLRNHYAERALSGLLVFVACAVVGFALYVLNLMVGMMR